MQVKNFLIKSFNIDDCININNYDEEGHLLFQMVQFLKNNEIL